mgnify:CR=1 FL=1
MTKADLIASVAETTDFNKKEAAEAVDSVLKAISRALMKGEKCTLVGFGVFEVKERAAREGRNPQNPSKVVHIPARKVPTFRPGKELREMVA